MHQEAQKSGQATEEANGWTRPEQTSNVLFPWKRDDDENNFRSYTFIGSTSQNWLIPQNTDRLDKLIIAQVFNILPVFKTSSIYGRQISHEEDQVVWKYQEKAQWLERDNKVPGAYSNRGGGW
jgi:hypothetical protein